MKELLSRFENLTPEELKENPPPFATRVFPEMGYFSMYEKKSGLFARIPFKEHEDPLWSPFGPEIADCEITTVCKNGACPWCMPAGTMISTPTGDKPIESLKVGDQVVGLDLETDTVEATGQRQVQEIYELELEDGTTLRATGEHPILTQRGWVEVQNLEPSDHVMLHDEKDKE